jgi:hypothetical protein
MRLPIFAARAIVILSGLFVLGACQWIGPRAVKVGMPAYNLAISETGHQLLLLNLVRMRYSETPYFMEISNIFASPGFTAGAKAGGTLVSGGSDLGSLGAEMTYSEIPTIVYTPLAGEKFARRLLQPIESENISLLYQGGWNLERILRLCVQRINNVWNAESATGPTPTRRPPEYGKFQRVAKTLHWLETNHLLEVLSRIPGAEREEGKPASNDKQTMALEFVVHPSAKQKTEVQQLFTDLELDPKAESYFFTQKRYLKEGRTLMIVTRPLIATMFYLSKGISIPQQDLARGAVHITLDDDGQPFDWRLVTADLFAVESSSSKPDDAYVAVRYRNSWFYIRDSDVISKDTFALFEMLLALRAGEVPESRTPLTLPIR